MATGAFGDVGKIFRTRGRKNSKTPTLPGKRKIFLPKCSISAGEKLAF
jgi:hypothetical protein